MSIIDGAIQAPPGPSPFEAITLAPGSSGVITSGLAAALPATGQNGAFYYATDTGALSFWTGSAWSAVTFGGAALNVANIFTQPQTLPVIDNGGQVFNAMAKGARLDGVTNDSVAMAATLTAAMAVNGVMSVPGIAAIGTGLNVTAPVRIIGTSMEGSGLKALGAITMLTYSNGLRPSMSDMHIDGNSLANYGIIATTGGAIQSTFTRVHISGCLGTPGTGFVNTGNSAYSMTWDDVIIESNKNGYNLGSGANNFLGSGVKCYLNTVSQGTIGDGAAGMSAVTFINADHETTSAQGVMAGMLVDQVQLTLINPYFESPGHTTNTDITMTGPSPSVVSILGYYSSGGGGTQPVNLISVSPDNCVLTMSGYSVGGFSGGLFADNSSGGNLTAVVGPGWENGAKVSTWRTTNGGISSLGVIASRSGGGLGYPDFFGVSGGVVFADTGAAAHQWALNALGFTLSGGVFNPQQLTTAAAAGLYAVGAVYYDTTLKKLRIGGVSAWETVTSV